MSVSKFSSTVYKYIKESNPAPVKYAAKLLGLCSDEIRLPLVNIKKETEDQIKNSLKTAELI